MANYTTWEERFQVIKDKKKREYWFVPVRKRLSQRTKFFDPSQLDLFIDSVEASDNEM